MNFLKRIAVLFYVTMVMFVSAFVGLFVLHYVDLRMVLQMLASVYSDETLRVIFGAGAGGFLLLNYIFYQAFTVSNRRAGMITFENPSGRVNVSLHAIEDMIKRVITQIPEVREVRSRTGYKKGLKIRISLILRAERSIPEITAEVQELVKKRVQEAIGLEEPIDVAINVAKILPDQGHDKRKSKKEKKPKEEENIPFPGYRA